MILPIVNINGTSSHELLQQQLNVLRALRAAREAMNEAAPHGRDYQLNLPGDAHKATTEHYERCVLIDKLLAQYGVLAEHLA